MSNSSIWPIDRTLLGATTLGHCGPGSDGNEGVLNIPQSSCITGASPSDCLVLYPGHSLWVLVQFSISTLFSSGPVGWGCWIHSLHLCRGLRSLSQRVSRINNLIVQVMRELWGRRSTPLLTSLPGPPWPEVITSDRVLSMGQIELNWALMLNWIARNRTVYMHKIYLG